jgi:hypothetical protein
MKAPNGRMKRPERLGLRFSHHRILLILIKSWTLGMKVDKIIVTDAAFVKDDLCNFGLFIYEWKLVK